MKKAAFLSRKAASNVRLQILSTISIHGIGQTNPLDEQCAVGAKNDKDEATAHIDRKHGF